MKIAIIHPSLALAGGAERVIHSLYHGLREKGHTVEIFSAEYNPEAWETLSFSEKDIHIIEGTGRYVRINSKLISAWSIASQLRSHLKHFDIVNAHNFPATYWCYSAIKKVAERPKFVWYCHEPFRKTYWDITEKRLLDFVDSNSSSSSSYVDYFRGEVERLKAQAARKRKKIRRDKKWDSLAFQTMDLILTNSQFTKDTLQKITSDKKLNIQNCHLGINMIETSDRECGSEPPYLLGFASPLNIYKNPITIIEATHILINKMDIKVRVKLVGREEDSNWIYQLVEQKNLQNHIEIISSISDEYLRVLMRNAAACIYIPLAEPFGIVPLEVMAVKTPAIVSNFGGTTESVVQGETGLFVDPFSPEDVAEKCRFLLDNPAMTTRMGEKGQNHVSAHFLKERFINDFENHLKNCLSHC